MSVNMALAERQGLTEEDIRGIEAIHNLLERMMEISKHGYSEFLYRFIEDTEYILQDVWGFPQDPSKHTWKYRYKFKTAWVGTKWRCTETGEMFTVPVDVEEKDCYYWGEAMLDVGVLDGYCRMSNCVKVEGT